MNYVNPFGIFAIPRGDGPDSNAIKQARSRALAEFELSQNTTVKFGDLPLNRSDVLATFDLLNDPQKAAWLWEMNGNLDLEAFLERNGKVAHPPENWGPLEQREYRAFTKEWIPPAMKAFFNEAIQRKDALSCRPIFEAMTFYPDNDQRAILFPVMEFLIGANRGLGDLSSGKHKGDKELEEFVAHTDPFVVHLYNSLPSFLYTERTLYAKTLLSMASNWATNHKHAKNLVPAIYETILELKIPEDLKKPALDYFMDYLGKERYFRNQIVTRKMSSSGMPRWFTTTVGCVVILFLIFLTYGAFKLGISLIFPAPDEPVDVGMVVDETDSTPSQNPIAQPLFPEKPSPDQ